MLAVMLVVEGARQASQLLQSSGEHQYSVLVSYETSLAEVRTRVISYAGKVRRSSLTKMDGDFHRLSTKNRLLPYEKAMFHDELALGLKVRGEQGRVNDMQKWINDHFILVNMSGDVTADPSAGNGYVEEVARKIQEALDERGGGKIRMVAIDYAGAMAERHLAATDGRNSDLRHLVKRIPLAVRNQNAIKFACPVWIFHQLSGEANTKQPTAQLHYADAAESKGFAENLDFCFIIGPQTPEHLCQIINSKHRRTGGHPNIILRVDGEFNRVEREDDYVLNPYTHTFEVNVPDVAH
jgi:hypothetical protein